MVGLHWIRECHEAGLLRCVFREDDRVKLPEDACLRGIRMTDLTDCPVLKIAKVHWLGTSRLRVMSNRDLHERKGHSGP